MAVNYPNSLDTFAAKTDGIDDVLAADFNKHQDAILAIETALGAKIDARLLGLMESANVATSTLSATKTLTDADKGIQFLDPGGAGRDVTLPAESSANHAFCIVNTADAAETLTVKDDGGATIKALAQGENGLFVSNGVAWKMIGGTSPAVMTGDSGSGGVAGLVPAPAAGDAKKFLRGDATWALGREMLTADRTYYVRTDGNDSNTGLSNTAGGAFATIQMAINTAADLDAKSYNITIQVADGTYVQSPSLKPLLGTGTITIIGNTVTPTNCIIDGGIINYAPKTVVNVRGFKFIKSSSSTLNAITAGDFSLTKFDSVNFGSGFDYHIFADSNSKVQNSGNYAISGGASCHAITNGGFILLTSATVTITGTPAFSLDFVLAQVNGSIMSYSMVWSGSATGARYNANTNGAIQTFGGGVNYFPGSVAGSNSTGGQYA